MIRIPIPISAQSATPGITSTTTPATIGARPTTTETLARRSVSYVRMIVKPAPRVGYVLPAALVTLE